MNKQEMRFKEGEIELIKSVFKDNEELLKTLRKIFLPEITADAPLGQNIDLWMTIPVGQMSEQQAIINLVARNQLIQHIESQLLQLKRLANTDAKTLEEAREQLKKDSTK
jgi:hypothetical protein